MKVYQHRLVSYLLLTLIAALSLFLIARALLNFEANIPGVEAGLGIVLLLACWHFWQIARQVGERAQPRNQPAATPVAPLIPYKETSHELSTREERKWRDIEDVYRRAIEAAG